MMILVSSMSFFFAYKSIFLSENLLRVNDYFDLMTRSNLCHENFIYHECVCFLNVSCVASINKIFLPLNHCYICR